MDIGELRRIKEPLVAAWNAQDVDAVVACYTDDLLYLDPNTRGPVQGADAMRRYLTRLFDGWQMHWTAKELFPLADVDGCVARWRASLTSRASGGTAEVDGIDLVVIEGARVARNEVYYDRAALAPALAGPAAS